jgi:hypothetical protein
MSGATRCQVKVPAHKKFRAGSFAREEHPSPTAFGRSSHAAGVAANTRTNTKAGLVAANTSAVLFAKPAHSTARFPTTRSPRTIVESRQLAGPLRRRWTRLGHRLRISYDKRGRQSQVELIGHTRNLCAQSPGIARNIHRSEEVRLTDEICNRSVPGAGLGERGEGVAASVRD